MKKCTLTVVLLLAVMVMATMTAWATEMTWSTGITLTEKEPVTQIGSRIEARRDGRLIGYWLSLTGQLAIMAQGLDYTAFLDCPGIRNIQKVYLSPDHGKTVWDAKLVEGEGYKVEMPTLPAKSYGLEWAVESRDKQNRMMLLVIPITWNSVRSSSITNQVGVQHVPLIAVNFNDQQWFALLRGFVSAEATLDVGYLTQQKLVDQIMTNQQPVPKPSPVVQKPEPAPMPVPAVAPKSMTYNGSVLMALDRRVFVVDDHRVSERQVEMKHLLAVGDQLIFMRGDESVVTTKIVDLAKDQIIASVVSGDEIRGDDIIDHKSEGGTSK